ncbi:DNA polymerase III subunit gamma/tau [Campylobacter sp. MIT 97-5078]|uniref:DNA polymerase III subunit gamma/tau n=1 Tax=Campylobacter sp. MIT 97-5078 TaxID=1548153 RepID=UPI0005139BE8|nr:DNA polymerase III subunit gamma/tau [Campylobacter sp. MIT 97-5078]KGI56324.1 DNA polymerase III subunit gamma/tau [Campylobacter sp. MIT 97-5078]KGI57547.1 DNA polymerase III subunit gamma/tau [Campylobacter sp. MIT 97-5078]KGI57756.1 DNA polymerase III subunit gamma/tau [Campylobacter sp. MIT 97-5078]TQR26929.1 DNA polymerase III subunit gamma/tau [Campylobacter sp. MIT 97-5078]
MLQALAIKYRPKTFDELIGQSTISTSLKYALNHQRLAHAYLFSGLRGSGKTSSARIFSRALVCEKGPSATPCGECKHCLAALEGKHIDIIEMDAASHRGLEDIQELIEQTKYAPSMARFKIFIIDEVHMLTPQAANALLKTLEEPPRYVKFILATTDPLKLPATVLSRTQHFRFKQIPQSEILKHLEHILNLEGVKFENEALKLVARSGQGSLRDTLTLLDQAIIFCENELTSLKIAEMLGFLDPQKVGEFYAFILQKNKEKVLEFLKSLQDYEASNVIDEMIFYLKESFFAKSEEFSLLIYERFFRILSRAKTMLTHCDDDAFVLCVMAFMLMEASSLKNIDEEIQNLSKAQVAQNEEKPVSVQKMSFNVLSSQSIKEKKSPYECLLEAIYDRDYTLGQCFERSTAFISFENGILSISSHAKEEDKGILNRGFKLIQELALKLLNASLSVQKAMQIDESKLQDLQKPVSNEKKNMNEIQKDLKAEFASLRQGARTYDHQAEAKAALDECFGEPTKE